MGQSFGNVCSCSVQYIKGYDDLPDRITEHSTMRKDSIVSFQSHKIVTTITLSPILQPKKTKHKQHKSSRNKKKRKHNKRRKAVKGLTVTIDDTLSVTINSRDIPQHIPPPIALQNMDELNVNNKTYVLYREGFCNGSDGESLIPINTITTGSMLEMDIDGSSDILMNKLYLNHIISRVPERYQFMKWKCLYSLLNDGCSMQTFYGNTEDVEQSILIIKDQSNNIFGAFLDSKWKTEYHHYNGSRDCFVYRFAFDHNEYSVFEYHSTGTKPYFLNSDYDGITIGAGECPAIYIENNLLMGRTTKSDTFHSEPLSTNKIFQIQNIEIWSPLFQ